MVASPDGDQMGIGWRLDGHRACVCMMVLSSHSPAARIVVPVSTRSTTASARPSLHAASTEPETNLKVEGGARAPSQRDQTRAISVHEQIGART